MIHVHHTWALGDRMSPKYPWQSILKGLDYFMSWIWARVRAPPEARQLLTAWIFRGD